MPSDFRPGGPGPESFFLSALAAAPRGTRSIVMDVGANAGDWSVRWASAIAEARSRGQTLELYLFEPQPVFRHSLAKLAQRINATFLPLAVGRHAGRIRMVGRAQSVTARTVEVKSNSEKPTSDTVPMIDFGVWMRDKLAGRQTLSFMKLDIEGTEYVLLPWLLTQARETLCLLHSMIIEWHLKFTSPHKRLQALGLELSFLSQLRNGCPTCAPIAVYNEVLAANQYGLPVPGLLETALMHAPWHGRHGRNARNRLMESNMELARMAAHAQKVTREDAQRRCASRRVACRSNVAFGEDPCVLDRISCDAQLSYTTYKRAVRYPVNATGLGDCAAGIDSPPWRKHVLD